MVALGWRAWYTDGRVFDSRQTAWKDLPEDGLLVAMVYFGDGTNRICMGDDFYWALGDGVTLAHTTGGSAADVRRRYPGASVKLGRWVADAEMTRVTELALESRW